MNDEISRIGIDTAIRRTAKASMEIFRQGQYGGAFVASAEVAGRLRRYGGGRRTRCHPRRAETQPAARRAHSSTL
jgi:hypothetical protein